jgi:hypothetical protein
MAVVDTPIELPAVLHWSDAAHDRRVPAAGPAPQLFPAGLLGDAPGAGAACTALATGSVLLGDQLEIGSALENHAAYLGLAEISQVTPGRSAALTA